ncbi:MAG: DUF1475 family protein [Anaerolineae bacterium]|nr:DUF1475 family protein [Anaerolineae bacterium]
MTVAKILAAIGFVIMAVAIIYGLASASFGTEGAVIVALTWGRITLIDIYISFLLIWGWMLYREASWPRALILLVLMIVLGSLTATGYTLYALATSGGDWRRFWLGRRV